MDESKALIIRPGDLAIWKDQGSFRVLSTSADSCVLLRTEVQSFDFSIFSYASLLEKIITKEISLLPREGYLTDPKELTEHQRINFKKNQAAMKEVEAHFGPSFLGIETAEGRSILKQIQEKYGFKYLTFRRLMLKYLQSGFSESSLITYRRSRSKIDEDQEAVLRTRPNKRGFRLGISDREYMIEAMKNYQKASVLSQRASYDLMIAMHYTDPKSGLLLPERPTFRQYTHFLNKNMTQQDKDSAMTSQAEVRTNKRLLSSVSSKNVNGPGDMLEIDAVELPVDIVSEADPSLLIGNPILYTAIDVYTGAIAGISVTLDNNSEIALTGLFLNMGEDKEEYSKRFGLEIDGSLWPSQFIPNHIRVDRGSDFKSHFFTEVCRRLNIDKQMVTGASGSLKGLIENFNMEVQNDLRPFLYKKGLKTGRYEDQTKKEACLNISDITKIVVACVLKHNSKYMDGYKLRRDMVKSQVDPIPVRLWNYGIEKYGYPRPIVDKERYCYDLLKKAEGAKLSRRGIEYEGLRYSVLGIPDLETLAYSQGDKKTAIDVRYDPRLVDCLFCISGGKLTELPLLDFQGNSDFAGLSFTEWRDIRKVLNDKRKEAEEANDQHRVSLMNVGLSVADEAARRSLAIPDQKTDLKLNRHAEKAEIQKQNSIHSRLKAAEDIKPKKTEKVAEPLPAFKGTVPRLDEDSAELDDLLDELS